MRKIINLILISLIPVLAFAQRKQLSFNESSIELTAGPSTLLLGDIGHAFREDYFYTRNWCDQPMLANLSFSFGYHRSMDERWAYKAAVHAGIYDRKDLDYAFRSSVFELTGRFEYRLFTAYYPRVRTLYLFGGVGFLYSNYTNDKLIAPKEKISVAVCAPVIPLGLGYKYELFDKFTVGAEFDFHYSFSDKLEGTKGGMPHDVFSTLSLVISYQISDGFRR